MSHQFVKFSPEDYAAYKTCYPMMNNLYPAIFDKQYPLPINAETIKRLRDDPYLRFEDAELDAFFQIWLSRREYTCAVCKHQRYYGDTGAEAEPIPAEIVAARAGHLARISEMLNMSNRAWKSRKVVSHGKASQSGAN